MFSQTSDNVLYDTDRPKAGGSYKMLEYKLPSSEVWLYYHNVQSPGNLESTCLPSLSPPQKLVYRQ